MGLYDSYAAKIRKIAKIKNTIIKNRVPILISVSLTMASIFGFLFSKGTITQNLELPSEIVYGEKYTIQEAEVLFGEAEYEYCLKGSTSWSKEYPTQPGTYLVRAISKGGFGNNKYGKEVEFTINPKKLDITLSSSNVVYGDDPSYSIDLEYSDYVSNVEFKYDDLSKEKTNVTIDISSIVILNKDGKDVTNFYEIETESKELTFSKRKVTLTPDILSKEYDGANLIYNNELKDASIESLAFDDTINVQTIIKDSQGNVLESLPKNAGLYTCEVDVDSVEIVNGNADTTDHYEITSNKVSFEITKKGINILTGSGTKVYDGQKFTYTSVDDCEMIDSSLINGHKLSLNESSNISSITNVGTVDNIFEVSVLDSKNEDVTSNYKITYSYGQLEVTPLKVSIIPNAIDNKVYDGEYVSYDYELTNYLSSDKELPEGENLILNIDFINESGDAFSSVKDASTYKYKLKSFEINNGLSSNYEVNISEEEFTIIPRDISIAPLDIDNFVYNGNSYIYSQYNGNYQILEGEVVYGENFSIDLTYTNELNEQVEPKDAGVYTAKISSLEGSINKDNYNIICATNNFEIYKKQITIKPSLNYLDYYNDVYDGVIHNYDYSTYSNYIDVYNDGLANNESLKIDSVSYYNKDTNQMTDYKNAGDYIIEINSHSFNSGVNKDNYDITYVSEEVSIYKRDVTLTPSVFENKEYDGKAYSYLPNAENFTYPYYIDKSQKLVTGESVTLNVVIKGDNYGVVNEAINADNYTVSIVEDSLVGTPSTLLNNYNFNFVPNYFTINPREVSIKVNPNSIVGNPVYDGNNHYFDYQENNYLVTQGSIVEGEEFYISDVSFYLNNIKVNNVVDAGNYEVKINQIIGQENIILDNYNFTYDTYNYVISPRNIIIRPINFNETGRKDYDGAICDYSETYNYANNFVYVSDTHLVDGEQIKIGVSYFGERLNEVTYIKHADNYIINIDSVTGVGNTNLDNYVINLEPINFVVNPKTVTIKPITIDDYVYTGIPYSYNSSNMNFEQIIPLVENEILRVEVNIKNERSEIVPNPVDVGTYTLSITQDNLYAMSNIDLEDYVFSFEEETFTIIQREITIEISEDLYVDKVYDGDYYLFNSAMINNGYYLVDGEIVNSQIIKIDIAFNGLIGNVKDAGTYEVTLGDYHINDDSINKDNYIINCNSVSFTISPRTIYISPTNFYESGSAVYDGTTYDYSNEYNNFSYVGESLKVITGELIKVNVIDKNGSSIIKNVGEYILEINNIEYGEGTLESNYNIVTSETDFEITKRQVTIKPKDIEDKYYDGQVVIYPSYTNNFDYSDSTIYQLVDGETITIEVAFNNDANCTPKDAGEYVVSIVNILEDKNILLDNYDFIYDGQVVDFTIYKREVTLSPVEIKDKIYDGKEVIYPTGESNFIYLENTSSEHKLVEGESITISVIIKGNVYGEVINPKNADNYVISIIEGSEVGLNNTNVNNYKFSYVTTGFVISPKEVSIRVNEQSIIGDLIYDGNEHYFLIEEKNYVTTQGTTLVEGEDIKITSVKFYINGNLVNSIKDAGTYEVKIDSIEGLNDTILSNYVFTYDTYLYTISPRTITIKPISFNEEGKLVYDGNEYIYDNIFDYENNFEYVSNIKLVEGESIKISVKYEGSRWGEVSSLRDADVYTISIIKNSIIGIGNTNINNYVINCEDIIFEITRRHIIVNLNPYEEKDYDGVYLENITSDFEYADNSPYELVENQTLQIILSFNGLSSVKDAGTYEIAMANYSINNGVIDKDNYLVECASYSYTISPRTISIKPSSIGSFIYDGRWYSYSTGYLNFDYENEDINHHLVEGEKIGIEVLFNNIYEEVRDAGNYQMVINNIIYASNTLESNYIINRNTETFEIKQREVNIKPLDLEDKIYDGYVTEYPSHSDSNHNYTYPVSNPLINQFVSGEGVDVKVEVIGTSLGYDVMKNADTYIIRIVSYEAISGTNINNYIINYDTTEDYVISPREVTLIPGGVEDKLYDGDAYVFVPTFGNYTYPEGATDEHKLVEGETIKIDVVYFNNLGEPIDYALDAGTYFAKVNEDPTSIECAEGTLLSNYIIHCDSTEFVIKPREVTITLNKDYYIGSEIYDGNSHYYDTNSLNNYTYVSGDGFVKNENIYISEVVFIDNDNKAAIEVYDAKTYTVYILGIGYVDGAKENNYIITPISDSYTIAPRDIYIKLDRFENKDYDGVYYQFDCLGFEYQTGSSELVNNQILDLHVAFTNLTTNEVTSEVKNAGEYKVSLVDYYLYDEDDNELYKGNYVIHADEYTFVISQRIVNIKPSIDYLINYTGKYNGKEITYLEEENYVTTNETNLVTGEEIKIKVKFISSIYGESYKVINAGLYQIVIEDIIGLNDTLIDNYQFIRDVVEFNVSPREVYVTVEKYQDKDYDGEYYLSAPKDYLIEETGDPLVDGHKLNISFLYEKGGVYSAQIKDVGEYNVVFDNCVIVNFEGQNIDLVNYILHIDNYQVTISPRNVEISPLIDETKIYDGKEYNYPLEQGNYFVISEDQKDINLLEKEGIKVQVRYLDSEKKVINQIKNAGDYYFEIIEITSDNELYNKDNYNFITSLSEFELTRRTVYLIPEGVENKIYDGKQHVFNNDKFNNFIYPEETSDDHKLVEGESLKIKVSYLDENKQEIKEVVNVGTYYAIVDLTNVEAGPNTLVSNYNIVCDEMAVFEVTPREITVYYDITKVVGLNYYDGNGRWLISGGNREFLYKKDSYKLVNNDELIIEFAFFKDGVQLDGAQVVNADKYIIGITDEDAYSLNSTIDDRTSEEIRKNYIIHVEDVEYEIVPRTIKISQTGLAESKTYDGVKTVYSVKEENNFEVEGELGVVEGEGITIGVYFTKDKNNIYERYPYALDAGSYTVCLDTSFTRYKENTLASNYDIQFVESTYTIHKRNLTIELLDNTESLSYDGQDHKFYPEGKNNVKSSEGLVTRIDGVVEKEDISIRVNYYTLSNDGKESYTTEVIDANTYFYTTDESLITIYRNGIEMGLINYNLIPIVDKSFVISKARITVRVSNEIESREYTGEAYSYLEENDGKFELISGTLYDQFTLDVKYYQNGNLVTPINSGIYYVYPDKLVGDKLYNYQVTYLEEASVLEIEKRKVSIKFEDIAKTYTGSAFDDSGLVLKHENFVDNDYVLVTGKHYIDELGNEYNPLVDAGVYTLVIDSIRFVLGDENNYDIEFIDSIVEITKTKVTITPYLFEDNVYGEKTYTYEYKLSNYNSIKFENSKFSHIQFKIKVLFETTINGEKYQAEEAFEAGKYQLRVVYEETEISENKLSNFEIIINEANNNPAFEIIKRNIYVYTGDGEFIYDGNAHSVFDGFKVVAEEGGYGLLEGHKFAMSVTQTPLTFTEVNRDADNNVIPYSNNIVADVMDEQNHPVTNNYNPIYRAGKVWIMPRTINVTSASNVDNPFIYNRMNQTLVEYVNHNEENLLNYDDPTKADYIVATAKYKYKNVGTYSNTLTYNVKRKQGSSIVDVTHNYEIIENSGTIVIEKATLIIEFNDMKLDFTNVEQIYPSNNWSYADGSDQFIDSISLEIKYDIYNSEGTLVSSLFDADEYELIITSVKVVGEPKDSDNIDIFVLNDSKVKYTIKKVVINIHTASDAFVYDGEVKSNPGFGWTFNSEYEILMHDFEILLDPTKEIPTVVNPGDTVENKLEVYIKELNSEKDHSKNFQLEYTYGVIKITNEIFVRYETIYTSIKVGDLNQINYVVYDYENWIPLWNVNFFIYDYTLLHSIDYDYFNAKEVDYVYEIGNYWIEGDFTYRVMNNDKDLTNYFKVINIEELNFGIGQSELFLRPQSKTKVYDGKVLTAQSSEYQLFDYQYTDELGYVNYIYSQLGINDRIHITTDEFVNAGNHTVEINDVVVLDEDGNDISYRYVIHYRSSEYSSYSDKKQFQAKYKIEARSIQVKTYGAEKEYDGTVLYNHDYDYIEKNQLGWDLLDGHRMELHLASIDKVTNNKYSFGISAASSKLNKLKFKFYDQNDKDVTSNYKVIYEDHIDGYLIINKVKLTITSDDASAVFDPDNRIPLTCNTFTYSGNLIDGHEIDCSEAIVGSLDRMGTIETNYIAIAENTIYADMIVIKDAKGNKVTKNYEIIVVAGTLKMYPPGTILN